MSFTKINERPFWICLSTDIKEEIAIDEGAICYEIDTGYLYWFFGGKWNLKVPDIVSNLEFVRLQANQGNLFTISKKILGIANDGYARLRLHNISDKRIVPSINVGADAKSYLNTYVNTTYSNDGTEVIPFNRKTSQGKLSQTKAYINPAITQLGSKRGDDIILGSTGPQKIGGSAGGDSVTVLMPGDDLLIEVQNKSGAQTIDVNFIVNYVEL